ncbi:MAG: hypothetical protein NTX71_12345 [Candidatus Aureabacteria bacterium]|nr:hypothetical protein [Candidatus Auribacterota bacterium]
MARIVIATLLTSMVILCLVWWPSMQMDKPTDKNRHEPEASAWSEIRETTTWLIGTVNGVMLIAAAFKRRRDRRRKR